MLEEGPVLNTGSRAVGTNLVNEALHYRYGYFAGPERQNMPAYERAMRTDPIISAAIHFIKFTMLTSLGDYHHPDPKVQAFVHRMFDEMQGNIFEELGQMIISMLWSGFAFSEKIFELKPDGYVHLKRLASYHPRSIYVVPNVNGELTDGKRDPAHPMLPKTGIWQQLPYTLSQKAAFGKRKTMFNNYVRIPLSKGILLTHNRRHGNWEGESALAPIWMRYQMVQETWKNLMITTERYGSPQVAAIVPKGTTSERVDNGSGGFRFKTIAEKAVETLSQMNNASALVFEEPIGMPNNEKIRIQNVSSFNNFGENFLSTLRHLYTDILIGMGVPPLLFMEHSGGLSAGTIAQVHAETYKQMICGLYKEVIEPFCEQVIGQLVYLNFGSKIPGKFAFNPYDLAAAHTLMQMFAIANQNGALDMSIPEDMQWVRGKIGAPAATAETMKTRMANNKKLMEALRRPDVDKKDIAKIKADTTLEVAEKGMEIQTKSVDKQARTQLTLADKNNQAKFDLEKLKGKLQEKVAAQQARQLELQNEQIQSGAAEKLHRAEAEAHIAKTQADADAHERKAKADIAKAKAMPKPAGPPKAPSAAKPAAPAKPPSASPRPIPKK